MIQVVGQEDHRFVSKKGKTKERSIGKARKGRQLTQCHDQIIFCDIWKVEYDYLEGALGLFKSIDDLRGENNLRNFK